MKNPQFIKKAPFLLFKKILNAKEAVTTSQILTHQDLPHRRAAPCFARLLSARLL